MRAIFSPTYKNNNISDNILKEFQISILLEAIFLECSSANKVTKRQTKNNAIGSIIRIMVY